jgi:hypothetical protein
VGLFYCGNGAIKMQKALPSNRIQKLQENDFVLPNVRGLLFAVCHNLPHVSRFFTVTRYGFFVISTKIYQGEITLLLDWPTCDNW